MQLVNCLVALGGDQRMVVARNGITIAELAVLQAIHDKPSVTDVVLVGEIKNFNAVAHRDRLRETYQRTESSISIDQLFPGLMPQMPRLLSEITLVDEEDPVQDLGQPDGETVIYDRVAAKPKASEPDPDEPEGAVPDAEVDADTDIFEEV